MDRKPPLPRDVACRAQLAASGMTNKDIAAELFISPKTVEVNLSRVYRKLNIRSRVEL
ncbi:MAG: helix-turn-helix transcriptional regulator, partial [Mycobacterium sp.]